MSQLINPGLMDPQELRDLMAKPARSVLDEIVATREVHPNELYRAIAEKRVISPSSKRDYATRMELQHVAELLNVEPHHLAKALGLILGIEGGGGLTQSYTELMYASVATGTQLNTFTSEASLQANLPDVTIPAGFFAAANGGVGRSLRVRAVGQLGTTGTPTFTFTVRLIPSLTWSAGGVGQSSAAITCGSGVTLAPWAIDMDIICRSTGKGGASNCTLIMQGLVMAGTAFAAGGGVYSIPGANTTLTVTLDPGATQYLYCSATCGTNNAANLIQLTGLKVWADN